MNLILVFILDLKLIIIKKDLHLLKNIALNKFNKIKNMFNYIIINVIKVEFAQYSKTVILLNFI